MAALRVKRNWWTRRQDPLSDISMFRTLARRWKPVVRVESTPVPLRLAIPTNDPSALSRNSFKAKTRYAPTPVAAKRTGIWNPWLWIK